MRTLLLSCAVIACGGTTKPVERQEAEPAWAAGYVQAVDQVCACTNDPCTRDKRPTADQILAAHGGVEEAPPSVQRGFQRLEKCWLESSRDLARDLGALTTYACGCTSFYCWEQWERDMKALARKYDVRAPEELRDAPGATESSRADYDRALRCLEKGTLGSDDFVAILQGAVDEMCACRTTPCAKGVITAAETKLAAYFNVGQGRAAEIDALKVKLCQCRNQASVDGEPFELGPLQGTISFHSSCK